MFRTALAATALLLVPAAATPGEVVISQKDRTFAPGSLKVKAGTTVRIVNDDRFIHNVKSKTDGFEFDSSVQRPGEEIEVNFSKPGRFEVGCAIHPKMRLTVEVED